MWVRHATGLTCPAESDHPDLQPPKPLVVGVLPGIPRLDPSLRASSGPSPALLLSAVGVQYRTGSESRKCRCIFGLRDSRVQKMWMENRCRSTIWNPYPLDVEGVECRKLTVVHTAQRRPLRISVPVKDPFGVCMMSHGPARKARKPDPALPNLVLVPGQVSHKGG